MVLIVLDSVCRKFDSFDVFVSCLLEMFDSVIVVIGMKKYVMLMFCMSCGRIMWLNGMLSVNVVFYSDMFVNMMNVKFVIICRLSWCMLWLISGDSISVSSLIGVVVRLVLLVV